jgi:replicative DNA helicase
MIILAGDTDTVGSQTMDRLWKEFGNHSYKLTWPDGSKDANDVFLNACGRDLSKFKNLVDELTSKAKSQPMPSVYSLQETMRSGDDAVLSDHPDRMRAPWHDVDTMVNIMPGDVVGINATNSGMGKSTFVLQWTLYNARKYGRSFVNFQAEMRPAEIATMVTAQVLRKDRNFLTGSDKKQAANELEGVEYYVGFDPVLNGINAVLDLLEAAIKRLSPYGVVLDHFHHLTTGMNNETQVQTAAMTRIKQIAETYKVVFFNVGQPRKATQQTKGKQIHLTDAKGSGAWADASNSVVTIHRELNKADDPTMTKGVYEDRTLVKLLKGRSMGTGNSACYLTSFGEFASFEQIDTNHESYEE